MPILSWSVFAFEGMVAALFSFPENSFWCATIVILINIIALVADICRKGESKTITLVLLLGLIFRLTLLLWDAEFSNVHTLPNAGADAIKFARLAAEAYRTGNHVDALYPRFVAFIYCFFGVQKPIAQYVNLLLSYNIAFIIIDIMNMIGISENSKRLGTILLSLLPNYAIINVILLRETIIIFLISVSLYYCIKWFINDNWLYIIGSVLAATIAAVFHSGALAIVFGEAVFVAMYDRSKDTICLEPSVILRALFIFIVFLTVFSVFGESMFTKFSGIKSVDEIVESRETSRGGSGYTVGISSGNNYINALFNTPLRMLYFVASPLPWQWRGIQDIIAFFFSAMFYFDSYRLAYTALKRLPSCNNHGLIILLLFLAMSSAFMFGWGVSNAGTALRHREKFMAVYILLFCLSKEELTFKSRGVTSIRFPRQTS